MTSFSKRTLGFWYFLNAVLLAALWLFSTGPAYLHGIPTHTLERLAQSEGLTTSDSQSLLYHMLRLLPGDPVFASQLIVVLGKVLAFTVLWWSTSKIWANPASPTLLCGFLFFSPPFSWQSLNTPDQLPALLFKTLGVGAIVGAKVPLLCAAVIGVTPFDPAFGLSLYFVMAYLALRRQKAYGLWLVGVIIAGNAALFLGLAGDYIMTPNPHGLRMSSFLCLLSLLIPEIRASRTGLYLAMLGASMATGASELASAVCMGDLVVVGLRKSEAVEGEEAVADRSPGEWRFERATVVGWVALLVLAFNVLDAEQILNRTILVPSQKARIALGKLFIPFSMQRFAKETLAGRWDFGSPFPALGAKAVEAIEGLNGPFRLLSTVQSAQEERRLGLVAALLNHRPLRGWATPQALSASSLACKAVHDNVLTNDETVVFLNSDEVNAVAPTSLPADAATLAPVSLANIWSLPFRQQILSEKEGAAYRLKTEDSDEVLYFAHSKAVLCLGAAKCDYLLSTLKEPIQRRTLSIGEYRLTLEFANLEQFLPSRTLVPVKVRLTNIGTSPVSTRETVAATLTVVDSMEEPVARQPFQSEFILFPKESLEVKLFLQTPPQESRFQIEAMIYTIDGRPHEVEIKNPEMYTTWRRLPPVGTWVEEPPTP